MNSAVASMLAKYNCKSTDDYINALREILQTIVLLGLWRGKFFQRAAFYGGTALRVLYGLDRFSEDMDFSLLTPDSQFNLGTYAGFVEAEISALGFPGEVRRKEKSQDGAVESAFLKANTREYLLRINVGEEVVEQIPHGQVLKIKIEVDRDPPGKFSTESKYLLMPIPFSLRVFRPSSLFAGKMHAVLCRGWKNRVKGRDWYDLVWYVSRETKLSLPHLEQRMRQSGHYNAKRSLTKKDLRAMLLKKIDTLHIQRAARDVSRFLTDPDAVTVWSKDFFSGIAKRIQYT